MSNSFGGYKGYVYRPYCCVNVGFYTISLPGTMEKEAMDSCTIGPEETFPVYYGKCHAYWMDEAEKELEEQNIPVTGGRLKTLSRSLAKQFYNSNTEDY